MDGNNAFGGMVASGNPQDLAQAPSFRPVSTFISLLPLLPYKSEPGGRHALEIPILPLDPNQIF